MWKSAIVIRNFYGFCLSARSPPALRITIQASLGYRQHHLYFIFENNRSTICQDNKDNTGTKPGTMTTKVTAIIPQNSWLTKWLRAVARAGVDGVPIGVGVAGIVGVGNGVRTEARDGVGGGFITGVWLAVRAGSGTAAGAVAEAIADYIAIPGIFYVVLFAFGHLQQCIIVSACLLPLKDRLPLMPAPQYPLHSPSMATPLRSTPINCDSTRNQSIVAFRASFNCDSNSKIPLTSIDACHGPGKRGVKGQAQGIRVCVPATLSVI